MAQGVESKLDNMLDHLDHLLASLEPQATGDKDSMDSRAKGVEESQSKSW